MSNLHVSIDIETLSTHKDAVILQIGAVRFDPNGDPHRDFDLAGEAFVRQLDADHQILFSGRKTDMDTIRWWSTQPAETFARVSFGTDLLYHALIELSAFVGDGVVWAGPAHFDVAILESAYEQVNVKKPWSHRSVRDLSTLKAVVREFDPTGSYDGLASELPCSINHDALHDAVRQARAVMLCRRVLRSSMGGPA